MPQKINKDRKDRIALMLKTGLSEQQIAERLHVGLRSVWRVEKEHNIKPRRDLRNITTDQEHDLWETYYKVTGSQAKVAAMFGVSRAAVSHELKRRGQNQ